MRVPAEGLITSAVLHLEPCSRRLVGARVQLGAITAALTHPDQHALRELLQAIGQDVAAVQGNIESAHEILKDVLK